MLTEQQTNDKIIQTIINYVNNAEDMIERQFVLKVAEEDIKQYVKSIAKFGLFSKWWKEPELSKEAKKFLKHPNVKSVSTLKQEVLGSINGEAYVLVFNLRCPSEFYYRTIRKKKISYMVNNCVLLYMRLEKYDREKKENIVIYEQGFAKVNESSHSNIEYIH